jgi:hypothetical protein
VFLGRDVYKAAGGSSTLPNSADRVPASGRLLAPK